MNEPEQTITPRDIQEIQDYQTTTHKTITHPDYGIIKCFTNSNDFVCGIILEGKTWEKNLFENWFKPFIQSNTTVIDCGAYIGSHTLLIEKLKRNNTILCFEMMPEHYKLLQDNIRLNQLGNVLAFNFALSDHIGQVQLPFVEYTKNQYANFGYTSLYFNSTDIKVPCINLDSMMVWIQQPVSFIKIDVEGYELLVLKGALNMINTFRPVILIEIWNQKLDEFLESEVWQYINKILKYSLTHIHEDDYILLPLPPTSGIK
jgi:FkbM family methyltransferase